jgi:hypothetical protein
MINEYLYTNYTSIYTEETITYTTNDSSKYGTVNNTYFLIEDGGYRDATTCEVKESENKLSTGSDVGNTCEDMFTDELINEIKKILKYIKILVPILIIVLGMVDFGRAMLASKEEEMKKAQSTFIKRLIIGVVIFLLPTIINSVLDLAQTAWKDDTLKNSNCIINELGK